MDREKKQRVRQYWYVIRELTSREIKRKYARSKLGIVWSVLSPLLHMLVLSLVFSYMFRKSIENYPIYYLCGHTLWDLFTHSTNSSMSAIADNKQMLIKVKYPMNIFVLSRTYTAFVNYLYSLIGFALMLCVFRVVPTWYWLWFPVIVAITLFFSLGIAYILATAYVFFGDVKHLYAVLLTLLMYLSALFYPLSRLPEILQKVVHFNPIFMCVDMMRSIMMYQSPPSKTELIPMIIIATCAYVTGRIVFKTNRNNIIQKL